MEAVGVVDVVDEVGEAGSGVSEVPVGLAVGFFGLERLHEAFRLGVVVDFPGRLMLASMLRSSQRAA